MRHSKALDKLGSLTKAPTFTSAEAQTRGVSPSNLAYYIKTGVIERVGHGIYRSKEAPTPEDFRWEDLYSAVSRVKDGTVCLISALAIYELTEEIPRQHWIAINNQTRHRSSSDVRIVRMRDTSLGKTSIKLGTFELPIFDRERCIVDAFRYSTIEIALKALKKACAKGGNDKINIEKIRRYAKALRAYNKIAPYITAVTT